MFSKQNYLEMAVMIAPACLVREQEDKITRNAMSLWLLAQPQQPTLQSAPVMSPVAS